MRRRGRLLQSSILAAALFVFAAPAFAETAPGDACTTLNYIIATGGPETSGVHNLLRCDGAHWQQQMTIDTDGEVSFGTTQIGNGGQYYVHLQGDAYGNTVLSAPRADHLGAISFNLGQANNSGDTAFRIGGSEWLVSSIYPFAAESTFQLSGDLTPAQITSNQNDYNPTGLEDASVLRLSSNASRDITGLSGGADGRVMTIFNVGSNPIVFKNQSTSSTSANRFALGADATLVADQSITLMYDATSQRWRSALLPFSQAPSGCFRTWTQWMTPAGDPYAISGHGIAASTDGTKAAAATGGYIYTTTDSGQTWIARTGLSNSNSIASSSDGLKLAATQYGGNIYTSTDGGATWATRETARNWISIASSSDGAKLVASVEGGRIYTSTNSGSSWTARASNRTWNQVASSSNGNILLANVQGTEQLYVSTDSGVTWTARASANSWQAIAVSSDGTKMLATLNSDPDGYVAYMSNDSGTTWTGSFPEGEAYCWGVWGDNGVGSIAAFSSDGSRIAFDCGGIIMSDDSGATWTKLLANAGGGLALLGDGKKILAQSWSGAGIARSECP